MRSCVFPLLDSDSGTDHAESCCLKRRCRLTYRYSISYVGLFFGARSMYFEVCVQTDDERVWLTFCLRLAEYGTYLLK